MLHDEGPPSTGRPEPPTWGLRRRGTGVGQGGERRVTVVHGTHLPSTFGLSRSKGRPETVEEQVVRQTWMNNPHDCRRTAHGATPSPPRLSPQFLTSSIPVRRHNPWSLPVSTVPTPHPLTTWTLDTRLLPPNFSQNQPVLGRSRLEGCSTESQWSGEP